MRFTHENGDERQDHIRLPVAFGELKYHYTLPLGNYTVEVSAGGRVLGRRSFEHPTGTGRLTKVPMTLRR